MRKSFWNRIWLVFSNKGTINKHIIAIFVGIVSLKYASQSFFEDRNKKTKKVRNYELSKI